MKALLMVKPGAGSGKPSMLPGGLRKVMTGARDLTQGADELGKDTGTDETGLAGRDMEKDPQATSGLDAGKISPEDAGYTDQSEECETCMHFEQPNSCKLVAGVINPEGYCKLHKEDVNALDTDALGSAGGRGSAGSAGDELSGLAGLEGNA